jgi:integrase
MTDPPFNPRRVPQRHSWGESARCFARDVKEALRKRAMTTHALAEQCALSMRVIEDLERGFPVAQQAVAAVVRNLGLPLPNLDADPVYHPQHKGAPSMNAPDKTARKKIKRTLSFLGKQLNPATLLREGDKKPRSVRVNGPYYDANTGSYRLVVFDGSRRQSVRADTQEEANRLKEQIESTLQNCDRTIGEAFAEFMEGERKRGLKERSLRTVEYKLKYFLPADQKIGSLTPEQAQKLYESEMERISRYGRVMRVQSHHSALKIAKQFFRWAVACKYISVNPFEGVRPIGKPSVGKEQLRMDEARRLTQVLVHAAEQGEEGAVATFCQLLLGLRSGEVLARVARDLDDDGWVLWIPSGKTVNARRRLEVPEVLRPYLLRLVEGQPPERLIFGRHRSHPYKHMWLWRQVKKYCQQANLPRVCPHSLRGLHSSLAVAAGCTSSAVASALGHGSFAVTAKHYVHPDTLRNSTVRRVADALATSSHPDDEVAQLLDRLRTLSPEARSTLLLALAAQTAN